MASSEKRGFAARNIRHNLVVIIGERWMLRAIALNHWNKKEKKRKRKEGGPNWMKNQWLNKFLTNHGYSLFSTMTGVLTTRASQEHNIRNKQKKNGLPPREWNPCVWLHAQISSLKTCRLHLAAVTKKGKNKKPTTLKQHKYVEFDRPGKRSPK